MWTYSQTDGRLYDANGNFVAAGYSGGGIDPKDDATILGKNNPTFQNVHNVGPIPVGWYGVGEPKNSVTHGRYAMALTPEPETETFGRDCFLMHGDSIIHPGFASEGCIIQPYDARVRVWESGDHRLQVVETFNVPTRT